MLAAALPRLGKGRCREPAKLGEASICVNARAGPLHACTTGEASLTHDGPGRAPSRTRAVITAGKPLADYSSEQSSPLPVPGGQPVPWQYAGPTPMEMRPWRLGTFTLQVPVVLLPDGSFTS